MDQQLYAITMLTKLAMLEELTTNIVCLVAFHTQCSYIACIGKLCCSSGLRSLLVDWGDYAAATVNQILLGKQYNRGIRRMTLLIWRFNAGMEPVTWNTKLVEESAWFKASHSSERVEDLVEEHLLPLMELFDACNIPVCIIVCTNHWSFAWIFEIW